MATAGDRMLRCTFLWALMVILMFQWSHSKIVLAGKPCWLNVGSMLAWSTCLVVQLFLSFFFFSFAVFCSPLCFSYLSNQYLQWNYFPAAHKRLFCWILEGLHLRCFRQHWGEMASLTCLSYTWESGDTSRAISMPCSSLHTHITISWFLY